MISSTRRAMAVPALALTTLVAVTACKPASQPPPPAPAGITLKEVCAAQKAWGQALVGISRAYDEGGGLEPARAAAKQAIDTAYGYNLGPVLFKPTLTRDPQTFRTTKEGALAYFVGGDPNYPNDDGFALKHWRSVEVRNVGVQINGDFANTMGKVLLVNKDGGLTTVDKTWVFKKDSAGVVRIVLHHSSEALPSAPNVQPPYDPKTDVCYGLVSG